MSYLRNLIFYHTITPLHIGCGQDVGVVDLPVIRERTTGYPFIPGSGIRGSLRDVCQKKMGEKRDLFELMGPEAKEMDESDVRYAGRIAVHDARILLFPVRSDQAPYLWVTCPAVLQRFAQDARILLEGDASWDVSFSQPPGDEELIGPFTGAVHLEELSFTARNLGTADPLNGWLRKAAQALGVPEVAGRTVVVHNETFHYFVTHATQVIQHNRLTASKTVAEGQLFSVEAVPPEAFFYGFLGATDSRFPKESRSVGEKEKTREEALKSVRDALKPPADGTAAGYLQLGGDEGTGLGVTRLVWQPSSPAAKTQEGGRAS